MFIINGLIGEGGFGKVLTCMHVKNKKWYAIKEINKIELQKHKTGVFMIIGELQAMKRVNHSFIIGLHMAFQDCKSCYFVMDLKTGGDLRYYLRKKLLFEEKDVAFIVSCMASALNHIHAQNIIHRDIKPENIILDEQGYPHLTDFGVAHVQNNSMEVPNGCDGTNGLSCNLASGTKQYLAPEVFTKSHVHGPESDYWSLGVVAYELLYGKRPFEKHCPTSFILYLEKAYNAKKSKPKDNKLKTVTSFSSNCSSASTNSSNGSVAGSVDSFVANPAYVAPHKNPTSSFSLGLFPPIIAACTTTEGSSDSSKNRYSSNVSYSPVPSVGSAATISQSSNSPSKLGPSMNAFSNVVKEGIAARSEVDTSSHGMSGPSRDTNLHGVFPHLTPPRPHGNKLPQNVLNSASPEHFSRGNSPAPGPDNSPDSPGRLSSDKDLSDLELDSSCRSHGKSVHSIPNRNAFPMLENFWQVDQGELPKSLVVPIPVGNIWLGTMSQESIHFLGGLFEVRPSHRLGVGRMDLLRNHPWLIQNEVNEWDDLKLKKFRPHFRPGKRYIQDTFVQSMDRLHEYASEQNNHGDEFQSAGYIEMNDYNCGKDDVFCDFKYIRPSFKV